VKVALVVPGFSSSEQDWCIPALLNYVRALARQAEAHVFTLRWPERGGMYPVFGATVHALDGRKQLGGHVFHLWARALRAIAAEHRRAPFDVIHAFWADEPGWVAALASRWLNIRLLLSLAGGELVGMPDIGYGLQLLPGRKQLMRLSLQQATRVTAGSEYLCGLARSACEPRKIVRAPLGVDTALFSPPEAERPAVEVIVNVGSLYPVKDQRRLICAFRQVVGQMPQAQLHIVGGGPLMGDLRALADGLPIRFLGEMDHAKLPEVYRGAAVFAQTSRHEAQGMAMLEAAACGLPVVGTSVGLLPEIGVVARDETELAWALVEMLRDPARRKSAGQAARRKVEAEFALAPTVERFRRLYQAMPHGGAERGPNSV